MSNIIALLAGMYYNKEFVQFSSSPYISPEIINSSTPASACMYLNIFFCIAGVLLFSSELSLPFRVSVDLAYLSSIETLCMASY